MTDRPTGRAMTMREIRDALGHTKPGVPEAFVRPTRYEVSVLPEDHINYSIHIIGVEARGNDLWAVVRNHQCLDAAGEWSWESIPSEREDEWLASHRFPLSEAFRLAKDAAPLINVNGITAVDAYRRMRDSKGAQSSP